MAEPLVLQIFFRRNGRIKQKSATFTAQISLVNPYTVTLLTRRRCRQHPVAITASRHRFQSAFAILTAQRIALRYLRRLLFLLDAVTFCLSGPLPGRRWAEFPGPESGVVVVQAIGCTHCAGRACTRQLGQAAAPSMACHFRAHWALA